MEGLKKRLELRINIGIDNKILLKYHSILPIIILNKGKWGVFMKINKTDKVLQIYSDMGQKKVNRNKNTLGKDEIKISERAKDYQFVINKLKKIPDMRMEKVDNLKQEIKSGNYNVEGKNIVEKIYENVNFDKRV